MSLAATGTVMLCLWHRQTLARIVLSAFSSCHPSPSRAIFLTNLVQEHFGTESAKRLAADLALVTATVSKGQRIISQHRGEESPWLNQNFWLCMRRVEWHELLFLAKAKHIQSRAPAVPEGPVWHCVEQSLHEDHTESFLSLIHI